MMAAIGLLGGTFDPVHIGHLRAAIESCERLRLDRVDLLPAADPPLKTLPNVSAAHRSEMVRCAIASTPCLGIDDRELLRKGKSFSIDTLADWRIENGGKDALVFIIGEDVLPTLDQWYRWQSLLDYCHLAISVRPSSPEHTRDSVGYTVPAVVSEWLDAHRAEPEAVHQRPRGAVLSLAQPALTVSSTAIRHALARGEALEYLLPGSVIEYIARHELYYACR